MKKILSLLLALMLVALMSVMAFASETTDTPGGEATSLVTVSADAPIFSVSVPTSLPLSLAGDGTVTAATNCKILNNCAGPIKVLSLQVDGIGDWYLTDWDEDYLSVQVDSTCLALKILDTAVPEDGSVSVDDFPSIDGNGELLVTYEGKLPLQSVARSSLNAANVVFTFAWDLCE